MENSKGCKAAKLMVLAVVAVACLTSVPAQAANKLIVKGTDGTTDKFVVTDGGFVGVGTSTPEKSVTVKGNSIAATQIVSHYTGTDPFSSGGLVARRNNVSTTNGGLPVAGDRVGYMLFGSVGTDGADKNAAGLVSHAEGTWTNSSFPAYFAIETAPAASGRSERMRVTGNGDVGIGSKVPKAKLEVNGGVRVYPVSANANTETPTASTKPACDMNTRGTLWFTPSATTDVLEICAKIGGNYAFKAITLAP